MAYTGADAGIRGNHRGSGGGSWARRFMAAAIIQGAAVSGLTVFLVLGQIVIKPEVSRVIAGGSAGTWFTFGYFTYITVGVIGVAVSSLFYHYLEAERRSSGRLGASSDGRNGAGRAAGALAWAHLVLMNAGATAASAMMMLAGYHGGAAMLPPSAGGRGFDAGQAHAIISPYVEPIAASILVLLAGVFAGGAGFLLTYAREKRQQPASSK
jgi:hypothetical protein